MTSFQIRLGFKREKPNDFALFVIPVQTGIQMSQKGAWIPAKSMRE